MYMKKVFFRPYNKFYNTQLYSVWFTSISILFLFLVLCLERNNIMNIPSILILSNQLHFHVQSEKSINSVAACQEFFYCRLNFCINLLEKDLLLQLCQAEFCCN